ncbi:hypothetical protein AAFF_G00051540 [Aldrovandia affinis]|uniref:Uncharacterized protein n=1 Tax=Aldrovandia affinis TaxID=143900 RepID=A0AAD7WZW8_9TELE|nr:hypothetical protein AAFF_G00051540 [Aldrovandia affinis]
MRKEAGRLVVHPTLPNGRNQCSGRYAEGGAGCFTVNVIQTGPSGYRDEYRNPVNAKGGPIECPFGNPLCEYGVRVGAGWECWNYHPLAAKLVKDPQFWAGYAGDSPDGEDEDGANGTRRSDPTSCASCGLRRLTDDPLQCAKHLG